MEQPDKFPELSNFIRNYFGEDFDLWGNTIEEIFTLYRNESEPIARSMLEREIDNFCFDNSHDLDASFKAAYGLFFNPVPWGHTTASFFDELKRLLSE